jgi:CRISPR-associated protein Cas1
LLSIEGRAAAVYWEIIGQIFPPELGFSGRERRGATDPINSALNYDYGILYSQVWGAIVLAGLDPFAGFLHTDRPGKPSLVLDLIEEFRSFAVDRPLVSLFTKGGQVKMEEDRIAEDSRRELAKRFVERLEEEETFEGKKHKLRTILQLQARHLAVFLRKEGPYKPFVGSW